MTWSAISVVDFDGRFIRLVQTQGHEDCTLRFISCSYVENHPHFHFKNEYYVCVCVCVCACVCESVL